MLPLEDEISKATAKHFPQLQHRFGPLAEKLDGLGLPGGEALRTLSGELADVLLTDASDAPQRLGAEESALYDGLRRAGQVEAALKQGLDATVRALQEHRRAIEALPESGVPGKLRLDLREELTLLGARLGQDDFYKHAADLNTTLTTLRNRVRDAAADMAAAQQGNVNEAQQTLQRLPEWPELTQEEQTQTLAELDALMLSPAHDLAGLQQLLRQEFVLGTRLGELKRKIEQLGRQRRLERLEAEKAAAAKEGQTKLSRDIQLPGRLTSAGQLQELIRKLQALQGELELYGEMEVTLRIED